MSRHVVVTGAASGIGAAVVAELRAAGDRVTGSRWINGQNLIADGGLIALATVMTAVLA